MTLVDFAIEMSKQLQFTKDQMFLIMQAMINYDSEYQMKNKDDASPICALLKESIEIQQSKLGLKQ